MFTELNGVTILTVGIGVGPTGPSPGNGTFRCILHTKLILGFLLSSSTLNQLEAIQRWSAICRV